MALLSERPNVAISRDSSGLTRVAIAYYARVSDLAIDEALLQAIKDGVRQAVLEDEQLRQRIEAAIKQAAVAMPLDVIAEAVKKAVYDMRGKES